MTVGRLVFEEIDHGLADAAAALVFGFGRFVRLDCLVRGCRCFGLGCDVVRIGMFEIDGKIAAEQTVANGS